MDVDFYKGLVAITVFTLGLVGKPLYDILKRKRYILWNNAKIKSQKEVYTIIHDIRSRLYLDRVSVFEYSNGDSTLSGIPFLYGTMTYEVRKTHISSLRNEYKKFPTSWFGALLAPIVDKAIKTIHWTQEGYYINNKPLLVKDEEAAQLLVGTDIQASLMVKFTTNIGDGILSLSNHSEQIQLSEREYKDLCADALQIWYHLKLKR